MEHKEILVDKVSRDDILAFSKEIADGQTIKSEDFAKDIYLDEVISKPWGHEYRIYADLLIDIWRLTIAAKQSTSMHCHPRKKTILICLQGKIRVNFIRSSHQLMPGDFISIPKGVFHSTDNIGKCPAELIEVETPRNKFDLVRAKDKYGRQGQRYETTESQQAICPMRQIQLDSGSTHSYAKVRPQDLRGDFCFSIISGREITAYPPPKPDPRFAISLSLQDAIEQNIEVISLTDYFSGLLGENNPYLVVNCNSA